MPAIKKLGVLTGGGDAPGLNAVIRAVVKAASGHGVECLGLEDSFDGLLEANRCRVLTPRHVTGDPRAGRTDRLECHRVGCRPLRAVLR